MALIDPLAAFVVAYIGLIIASMRGAKAYVSILIMILIYAVLASTPIEALNSLERLSDWNDARVFIYIFLSLTVAGIMREAGLLDRLVDSTGKAGCRFSMMSVPAILGLIPMPGGALVSAIALRRRFFEEARLGRDEATFINYWFRHLWVPSWPLFQSVVITAAVFAVDPLSIVSHTWPGTVAAIVGGLLVGWPLMRGVTCPGMKGSGALREFVESIWPLLLLAGLFLAARTSLRGAIAELLPGYDKEPMLVSLLLVVIILLLAYRPGPSSGRRVLELSTKPTIHAVLFESLYFKNLIIETGAASSIEHVAASGLVPAWVLILSVPFILGLAAGGENFFASSAMPLLVPYIAGKGALDWGLLALAYLGGYLGVMASPVHLCLVLTAEYYGSSLGRALRYVLAAVAVSLVAGVLILMAIS
ncbi:MAG: DUF401 family protein [Desulfurococcales archaeon]|nr:DUF401 family protein [Desulfurococcales archaeon]